MNEKHLYTLLNVIKTNGDIRKLKREGIEYKEIAELTKLAITKEYVQYENDIVKLSDKGLEKINELDNRYKVINKDLWIEAENKSKIPKLEKDFIFLPNQNEIHF
jgi:hypothetical protein